MRITKRTPDGTIYQIEPFANLAETLFEIARCVFLICFTIVSVVLTLALLTGKMS